MRRPGVVSSLSLSYQPLTLLRSRTHVPGHSVSVQNVSDFVLALCLCLSALGSETEIESPGDAVL